MAVIALTATQVDRVFPQNDEVLSVKLGATVTRGQVLYQDTDGTFKVADANGSGTIQARGIALQGGASGQVIPMLKRGVVSGYTVSSLDADVRVYLSDTVGSLDTAAGSTSVTCGRVFSMTDGTKLLYLDFDWLTEWA